jgi:hypothetical protein
MLGRSDPAAQDLDGDASPPCRELRRVRWRSLTALSAHPTLNREYRSMMVARYRLAVPPIRSYVVSPTQH